MKKYFLSQYILGCLILLGFAVTFSSCEDEANDWGVDGSQSQMFTPVKFEPSRIAATSVDLAFSGVPNAKSYVIEISQDSLEFTNIISTVEILKENLVPDPNASGRDNYIVTIDNLESQVRYSARIKSISVDGLPDSKWAEGTFRTPSEQIVSEFTYGESSAILKWQPGLQVTHYIVSINDVEQKLPLTQENISAGELEITDLEPNTDYVIYITNGDRIRGRAAFKTYPKVSGDGEKFYLAGDEDIVEYLNALTAEQVVLVLPAGSRYEIGDAWTLPAHITSLTLWGLPATDEPKAYLNVKEIKLDASVTNFKIWIQNMIVEGTNASADYLMNDNPSSDRTISDFRIENSDISAVRGIFRMRNKLTVQNITIDNCIINNIGSYGVVSQDAATVVIGDINIKNSTVYNINNTNVMAFKGITSSLVVEHCTFYNAQAKDRYFANFDNNAANIPATFRVSDCIFSAPDASVTVRGTNPKIDSQYVFGSYRTNDYTVAANYPLTGVLDYSKSSADLFENVSEGNFKIKDISIGGDAQPGDPRWW